MDGNYIKSGIQVLRHAYKHVAPEQISLTGKTPHIHSFLFTNQRSKHNMFNRMGKEMEHSHAMVMVMVASS